MATKDSTTNAKDESTPESFFPEDARERNFADARETAIRNHEKDMATRRVGYVDEDRVEPTESVEVINPAEPPLGDASERGEDATEGDDSDESSKDSAKTKKTNKKG